MSKEGSTEAPIRHPIDFESQDFLNPEKLDTEMRECLIFAMVAEDALIYVTHFQNSST